MANGGGATETGGATKDGSCTSVGGSGGRRTQRLPSLRLANGRVALTSPLTGSEEEVRSPRSATLRDDIKISVETTTCTDSLVTAVEDETAFVNDYISPEMNYRDVSKVHFGGDDVSLYGTPKEELGPGQLCVGAPGAPPGVEPKPSFLKNQLQALFQPTDNKLAMKLFGSKKALMKERVSDYRNGDLSSGVQGAVATVSTIPEQWDGRAVVPGWWKGIELESSDKYTVCRMV